MSQQFSGSVEILNTSSGSPTVILEGGDDKGGGDLTLGGYGQSGSLLLRDGSGRPHLFASGNESRPFLRLEDNLGITQIELEGDTGNIKISGKLYLSGKEISGSSIQDLDEGVERSSLSVIQVGVERDNNAVFRIRGSNFRSNTTINIASTIGGQFVGRSRHSVNSIPTDYSGKIYSDRPDDTSYDISLFCPRGSVIKFMAFDPATSQKSNVVSITCI
jgi:hypothetical protein